MIKEFLTANNKINKCLALTNLAALLSNGTTIHKFSCKLKKIKKNYGNEIRLYICR